MLHQLVQLLGHLLLLFVQVQLLLLLLLQVLLQEILEIKHLLVLQLPKLPEVFRLPYIVPQRQPVLERLQLEL